MNRPRTARAVAAALVLGLAGGCGVPTQHAASVIPDKDVPSGLLTASTTTTTTTPPSPDTPEVTICLVSPSGVLQAARQRVPSAGVDDVLTALASPPSPAEQRAGLSTLVTSVLTARVKSGVATVALGSDFTTSSSVDQLTAVAQIVCTLTALPGIGQVGFQLDGKPADVPRGDGSTTAKPVSRDDYPKLIPAKVP